MLGTTTTKMAVVGRLVIGLFVGIEMFFYGGWLVSLALSVRMLTDA